MRHVALITIALLLSPLVIKAADDLTVLKPGPNDPPPKKQLYAYLEAQAKSLFDTRRKAVAALKTPQDVAIRQAKLKQNLLKALGDLPAQKTSLNPRLIGRDQIWFTSKLVDGSSRLYPLLDFDPRRDENFSRRYVQGMYGAIPLTTQAEFEAALTPLGGMTGARN